MTRVHRRPKQRKKIQHMKNRNNIFTTTLVALAFALALGAEASPKPDGGPTYQFSTASSNANGENGDAQNLPMITIHSTDNVIRGKTGSFVLDMKLPWTRSHTHVRWKVCKLQGKRHRYRWS